MHGHVYTAPPPSPMRRDEGWERGDIGSDTLIVVIVGLKSGLGNRAVRLLTVGTLSVLLLAGCSTGKVVGLPSPTTTPPFTHAQVLGWVAPTLQNGITLVGSVPPGATNVQLFAASRPLNTATSVSTNELAEVTWTGPLQLDEKALVRSLLHLQALTASTPGPSYLSELDTEILSVQVALQKLTHDVKS
jgi:hypothetical protein